VIDAVIFDLDGVLIQSEEVWDEVRVRYVAEQGGRWEERATRDMMGMSSGEWSAYLHDELGVPHDPEQINADVVEGVLAVYRDRLPLIDGAVDAVRRVAGAWPLGLASSSNRPVIDEVLARAGITDCFRATVSSEEVGPGKPAPDVYEEAARRVGVDPARCAAIEDSHNGIASAHAAGMRVIAIPNPGFPPGEGALENADVVLNSLVELSPAAIAGTDAAA